MRFLLLGALLAALAVTGCQSLSGEKSDGGSARPSMATAQKWWSKGELGDVAD